VAPPQPEPAAADATPPSGAADWIGARLAAAERSLVGPLRPVRIRAWSAVWSAPTDAGTVWFKAAASGCAYEAALVEALARWVPDRVVAPLAVDTARGWLLSPDGGPTLRERDLELAGWEAMLRAYAQLQRDLTAQADELRALGTPDQRTERMPEVLAGLLAGEEVRAGLGPQRHERLVVLRSRYARWCAELAADGIPASLQHDDLSDANVFGTGTGFRFFDWGDASVAHPFASLLVGLNVAKFRLGLAPGAPELARLRDVYLEAWTDGRDRSALRRSATLAMRVGKVGRALSWHRALSSAMVAVPPEYADAVTGWLEALEEPDTV